MEKRMMMMMSVKYSQSSKTHVRSRSITLPKTQSINLNLQVWHVKEIAMTSVETVGMAPFSILPCFRHTNWNMLTFATWCWWQKTPCSYKVPGLQARCTDSMPSGYSLLWCYLDRWSKTTLFRSVLGTFFSKRNFSCCLSGFRAIGVLRTNRVHISRNYARKTVWVGCLNVSIYF